MAYAVLFPGQGSQFVGMGADVFDARPDLLGERAGQFAGFSLRSMCLEASEDELTRTEHAQPALFAVSYALWDELSTRVAAPAAAAGHSLGEYTALAAAGVFPYDVALGLVAARGRAMGAAADIEPSSMAALVGADLETAESVTSQRRAAGGKLWVANINAPGQVVVAGGADDIAWLTETGRELGIRRVVPLTVAGAFHSPFMEPAAQRVRTALEATDPAPPRFPVYANLSASPHVPGSIVDALAGQVVSPVRFAEILESMASEGIDTFVHVGPGDVTAGLARRTLGRAVTVHAVSSLDDIPAVADALGTMD